MKTRHSWFVSLWLLVSAGYASSEESTIRYHADHFLLGSSEFARAWDLDGDGTTDFAAFGTVIGAEVWAGADSFFFLVGAGANELLIEGIHSVVLLSSGTPIGKDSPPNSVWGNRHEWSSG